MNFEQFIGEVKKEVKSLVGNKCSVSVHGVLKTNRELQGLSIRNQNEVAAPTVYLEDYYAEHLNGKEINQIAKEIIDLSNQRKLSVNNIIENIQDYEWVKPRLRVKLINYEKNTKLFQTVLNERMLDLAIVPYILISKGEGVMSSIVNYQLLDNWGIQKEEVIKLAKENTMSTEPVIIENMKDYILQMMFNQISSRIISEREDDQEELIRILMEKDKDVSQMDMYISTNRDNLYGAFVAMQKKNLLELANQIGIEMLYILPSSIHEIIVIPAYENIEIENLREMVFNINRTDVAEEDFLSDIVYLFDKKTEQIYMMNK